MIVITVAYPIAVRKSAEILIEYFDMGSETTDNQIDSGGKYDREQISIASSLSSFGRCMYVVVFASDNLTGVSTHSP